MKHLTCIVLVTALSPAWAQNGGAKDERGIQDNSFLIEEAYNQERGVVQHISTFSRMWNSKDWSYTFTQEWPAPRNWRHQLSYTLAAAHAGAFAGSGIGLGDLILNYRYQLLGDGEARFAFASRLSIMMPTGDVTAGRGTGAPGIQANLPLSIALHRRLTTHWNAGSTFVPHAKNADHIRAATVGYTVGGSLIFAATPRVNLIFETVDSRFQSVIADARTEWVRTTFVSPGIRFAHNFRSGLQIVPGVAIPVGVGPSAGTCGIFLYLSFEHPFGAAR